MSAAAFAAHVRAQLRDAGQPHGDAALVQYLATLCLSLSHACSSGYPRAKPATVIPFKPRRPAL